MYIINYSDFSRVKILLILPANDKTIFTYLDVDPAAARRSQLSIIAMVTSRVDFIDRIYLKTYSRLLGTNLILHGGIARSIAYLRLNTTEPAVPNVAALIDSTAG